MTISEILIYINNFKYLIFKIVLPSLSLTPDGREKRLNIHVGEWTVQIKQDYYVMDQSRRVDTSCPRVYRNIFITHIPDQASSYLYWKSNVSSQLINPSLIYV